MLIEGLEDHLEVQSAMLKQQPQTMTAEQLARDLARELRDVRCEFEEVRRQTKSLSYRTSQLYLQLDKLKQTTKGDGR